MISFVAGVLAFLLIRSKDFVPQEQGALASRALTGSADAARRPAVSVTSRSAAPTVYRIASSSSMAAPSARTSSARSPRAARLASRPSGSLSA